MQRPVRPRADAVNAAAAFYTIEPGLMTVHPRLAEVAVGPDWQIGYAQCKDALRLFAWHEVDNYGDRLGPALFHLLTGKPTYIEARGLELIFDQGPPRDIRGTIPRNRPRAGRRPTCADPPAARREETAE